MKKVLVVLLILIIAGAGVGGTLYYRSQFNKAVAERNQLVQQTGELQVAIDAIGPITEVWTVKTHVLAGAIVKEEELVQQTIPVSSVTEQYVMDKSQIIGKYYKIDMHPGVAITKDTLMSEPMEEIMYERDMSFKYLPLGLKVGDYIDIRITYPYGQEFVVIQHERVQQLVESSKTIKLILNEAQLMLWMSAMKDYALTGGIGTSVYVTKYIEPGITQKATPYYPVRKEMEQSIMLSPNIKDKTACINSELRDMIDSIMASVQENHGSALYSGVESEASGINAATSDYEETNPTGGQGESLQDKIQQGYDDLINLEPSDINGNTGSISDSQREETKGDNVMTGEDPIE